MVYVTRQSGSDHERMLVDHGYYDVDQGSED
jgi:hypothetical protein